MSANEKFDFNGINHLALVCRDMKKTVDFYQGILGMPLTKTINLPGDAGQHFFFDCGGGDQLAFFWFPDAPDSEPGVTHAANLIGGGSITSAHASMNHVAFDVSADKIEEYYQKLQEAGVECTPVVNHDDSPATVSPEINETTFVRSIYFKDPDGILVEMAAWTRELTENDVNCDPISVD